MKRSRMRSSLLAVVATALFALLPAAAGAMNPSPTIVSGYRNGPEEISGGGVFSEVAALPLPPGMWYVRATAYVEGAFYGMTKHTTTCKLMLGAASDAVTFDPPGVGGGLSQSLLLTLSRRFTAPGSARLVCASNAATGDVRARFVKITAIEIGRLTNVPFGGTATTVGSASPRVISGYRTAYTSYAADDRNHQVARLVLPAGRWWILAKGVVAGAKAGKVSDVKCTLGAGTQSDETRVEASAPGLPADQVPIGLQVTADLTVKGAATLVCTSATGNFKVGKLRINAFQAGMLTTGTLETSFTTTGNEAPVVISGLSPGGFTVAPAAFQRVRYLSLPAGSFAVSAKVWVGHVSGPTIATTCELRLGADFDQGMVWQAAGILKAAPLMLQAVHTYASPGLAELWCRQSGSSGQIGAYNVQMTAVRAGTFSNSGI